MSTQKLHDMAGVAADLAYAYTFFDDDLGAQLETASTEIILAHDIGKEGGYVLRSERGKDFLTMTVQLQGCEPMTVHFDRTNFLETNISVSTCERYRDNNMEPI